MNNHLSQDQFERCVSGRAGPAELEHIHACMECRAEVEGFSRSLAMFRKAVHDLAGEAAEMPAAAGLPKWQWTVAVATLVTAIVVPFFIGKPAPAVKPSLEMSPEAVMERLNRHLEQTMPGPMEPMMSLISGEPFGRERDGIQ